MPIQAPASPTAATPPETENSTKPVRTIVWAGFVVWMGFVVRMVRALPVRA